MAPPVVPSNPRAVAGLCRLATQIKHLLCYVDFSTTGYCCLHFVLWMKIKFNEWLLFDNSKICQTASLGGKKIRLASRHKQRDLQNVRNSHKETQVQWFSQVLVPGNAWRNSQNGIIYRDYCRIYIIIHRQWTAHCPTRIKKMTSEITQMFMSIYILLLGFCSGQYVTLNIWYQSYSNDNPGMHKST